MRGVYLGIGTNLGDRLANLNSSVAKIEDTIGRVIKTSAVYETEPWGFESENQFLNMVIEVETRLRPSGVLGRILMTEAEMGRLRRGKGYESRIIDIDILLFGNLILDTESLVIPHPKLHERKFVLVPLTEIAPELVHPVLKKDMMALLSECTDKGQVAKVKS